MIYLDNSATTALSEAVKQKMIYAMEQYGNPSSTHALGIVAKRIMDEARDNVAAALGLGRVNAENLVFTSCGSEANNMAILGCAYSKAKRRASRIITTDSEHSSVENAMKRLEADGFEVIRLSTRGGVIDEAQFMSYMDTSITLLSI